MRSERKRNPLIVAALVGVSAVALAGCAPSSSDSADAARADRELGETADERWHVEARPVGGGPVVFDGVALAYVLGDDDNLAMTALDATDGTELWTERVSTAWVERTTRLSPIAVLGADDAPLVVTATTPSMAPGDRFGHRLQARDVHSGDVVAESEAMLISDPHHCRTTTGICFDGAERGENEWTAYRFDPVAGTTEAFEDLLPGFGDQVALGGGLYAVVDESGTERLIELDDGDTETSDRDVVGEPAWSTPVETLFGPGVSFVNGLRMIRSDRSDEVRTAVLFGLPADAREATGASDLSRTVGVAIDLETGEARWTTAGGGLCGWVRVCTGEVSLTEAGEFAGGTALQQKTEQMTVTRLDPLTGEERWRVELGEATFDEHGELRAGAVEGHVVVGDGERIRLIDLETGADRAFRDGDVLACSEDATFLAPGYSMPSKDIVEFRGGSVVVACDDRGEVDAPLSVAAVRSVADSWDQRDEKLDDDAEVDENAERWRVLQTRDAIVGYRF